jgi:predicted MFS family arabinose efflux permease
MTEKPMWAAVWAMALAVAGLLMAELLLVSLLTPMAADLGITEGLAGQTVTATAAVALVSSLVISAATRRLDRRHVLLAFSLVLIVSSLLVGFAPNLPTLLAGRLLLGVATGGFWSMSGATAMRLVPAALVPRALSIVFGAGSIATVIAAPLGSALGAVVGWRGVFLTPAAIGLLAVLWQLATLPSMAPSGETRLRTLVDVLKRPRVGVGMAAILVLFAGQFAVFTYLRPFLETVTGVSVGGVSAILFVFGVASFVGSTLAGAMLQRSVRLTLGLLPVAMSVLAAGLAVAGRAPVATAALVALWGFANAIVPVGWQTWVTHTVPDQAETGGGLLVGTMQLAITIGAAGGGMVFDARGPVAVFAAGSAALLLATPLTLAALRTRQVASVSETAVPEAKAA